MTNREQKQPSVIFKDNPQNREKEESAGTSGPERIKQPWQISLSQLRYQLRPVEVLEEMN